jgi:XapX domain-containing protein
VTIKVIFGCLLALTIGVLCRLTGIPLPAPVALLGGMLVMAMTVGYELVDRYVARSESRTRHLSGGPSGKTQGDK